MVENASTLPTDYFHNAGVVKVGDETSMVPDMPTGLISLYERVPREVGVAYYTMFDKEVLLVSDPTGIDDVLDGNVEHYLWGGMVPASKAFFGPKVLFVLEGKEWQTLRRVLRPPLLPENLPDLASDVADVADIASEKLRSLYVGTGKTLNAVELARLYHLSAASRTMLQYDLKCIDQLGEKEAWATNSGSIGRGGETGSHAAAWTQSFDFLLEELARRIFDPDPKVSEDYTTQGPGRDDNRRWKMAHDIVHGEILPLIRARLEERQGAGRGGREGDKKDMLDLLLDAYAKEATAGDADFSAEDFDEVLGANVVEILFAGYNTVTNVMAGAMFLFSQYPEELAKLRAELDAVLGGRTPTWADIERMEYTSWSFFETLRLMPPAPAIARKITEEMSVNGVTIPVDSEVMLPLCAVHRDPAFWDEPARFDPARFATKPRAGTFVPFSGGPRRCLGQHYARMVYMILIGRIAQDFDFTPSPEFQFQLLFTGFGWGAGGKRTRASPEVLPVVPMTVTPRTAAPGSRL